MKTLKDFIKKTYSVNDIFNIPENILEYHFYLEFGIRDRQNISINEKYGKYDGQLDFVLELANVLYSDIIENVDKTITYDLERNDLDDMFTNIFFNKLTVKYSHGCNTGYIPDVQFNDKDKKIEHIQININANKYITHDDIITVLVHELTHAWEDYNRYLQNKDSLYDIANNTNYKKIKSINTNITAEKLCKSLLYRLKRFERNAYISEFASLLDKQNELITSYKDAVEIFINSEVWNDIQVLKYNFEKQYNKQEFIDCYNKLNNTHYTANKIHKKISRQIKEYISKLETLIPKLYYEYYEKHKKIPEGLIPRPGDKFIEILKLKNYNSKICPLKNIY